MCFIAVDLFTAGHGDEPILIDKTPPEVGTVLDGNKLQKDLRYQADNRQICAQWLNFFDPESGIDRYDFFYYAPPFEECRRALSIAHVRAYVCPSLRPFVHHLSGYFVSATPRTILSQSF